MARFYGSVQGQRGEATRLGGKGSGLVTVAASYSGAVRVHLYDNDGADWARIELTRWKGAGEDHMIYEGPVDKLHRIGLTGEGKHAYHSARGPGPRGAR